MDISKIAVGNFLRGWHDEGANMGMGLMYFRVIRLGKVKVRVRSEYGHEGWMYPANFDKVLTKSPDFVTWH